MATNKSTEMMRDPGDVSHGMAADPHYAAPASGGTQRSGEVNGPQVYGTGGGAAPRNANRRDFYREAMDRMSMRSRDLGRWGRDDLGRDERYAFSGRGPMDSRGEPWRRSWDEESDRSFGRREEYAARGHGPDRFDELRGLERTWREVLPEDRRGDRSFRGDEPREDHDRRASMYRSEPSMPSRTMAMAAAGLGAAGLGLGLMRRGRWAREPLSAREVMSTNLKALRPEHTLRDAARLMREENVGIVPVMDSEGRLMGVVTDRDLVVRAVFEDRTPSQVRISEVMSSEDLEVATPDESIHDIIELMGRRQVRRIPVVERDNRLVGIIAMSDIATRADQDEDLQHALERISQRRSFWARLG